MNERIRGPKFAQLNRKRGKTIVDEDLDQMQFPEREWLVEGLLPMGKLVVLGGKPKVGKTLLVTQLATCIAFGEEFLGRTVKSGKVLYLALEDDLQSIQERRRKQRTQQGSPNLVWSIDWPVGISGIRELDVFLSTRPDFVLVVIDVFTSFCGWEADQLSAGEMRDMMDLLRKLTHKHHLVILSVDHHKKGDSSLIDLLYGSVQKAAGSDLLLSLCAKGRRYLLDFVGRGIDAEALYLERVGETHTWKVVGEGLAPPTALDGAVIWLNLQLGDGPKPLKKLEQRRKAVRIGRNTMYSAAEELNVESSPAKSGRGTIWSLPKE